MILTIFYLWNFHPILDKIREWLYDSEYEDYDSSEDLFGFEEDKIEDNLHNHTVLIWIGLLFISGVIDSILIGLGMILMRWIFGIIF